MVVSVAPLRIVVPVVAFWMKEAALIAPPKVVVPVEVRLITPKALLLPTAPVKVRLPEPVLIARS